MPSLILIKGKSSNDKSRLAANFDAPVLKVDMYFIDEKGAYRFDGSKLSVAHEWCLKETEKLLVAGNDVVVANTFSQSWELRPYYAVASRHNVEIRVIQAKGYYNSSLNVSKLKVTKRDDQWLQRYDEQLCLEGVIIGVMYSDKKKVAFQLEAMEESFNKYYVQASRSVMPIEPLTGEIWRITGWVELCNGLNERLHAVDCYKTTPTGTNLINFIALNSLFYGIGAKTARKLYTTFQGGLSEILHRGDVDLLIDKNKVGLNQKLADILIKGWKLYHDEIAITEWLERHDLPVCLSPKILALWGDKARNIITTDPYNMLTFSSWEVVDKLAFNLGVSYDDERRVSAAVEWICYKHYDNGNTAVRREELEAGLRTLLHKSVDSLQSIKHALRDRVVACKEESLIQLTGAFALEQRILRGISERIAGNNRQKNLFSITFEPSRIVEFENRKGFLLGEQQRIAVETVISNQISCIFGGAGVGKSTVLETIFDQIGPQGMILQMAHTCQAAKRMVDSPVRKVITIAKFLKQEKQDGLAQNLWVFIGESNMLDVPTMYQVIRQLPITSHICFIGDSHQLPPNGPGLVFHAMEGAESIPQVELTHVYRHEEKNSVTRVASDIKGMRSPILDEFVGLLDQNTGVSFVHPESEKELQNSVVKIYRECNEQGKVKIIAAKNTTCAYINSMLHEEHKDLLEYRKVHVPIFEVPNQHIDTGMEHITVGEPILWHRSNDSTRNLYNGSLGTLKEVYTSPVWGLDENGRELQYLAEAEFEGEVVRFTEEDKNYINLGYCIPCHKAQGTKFERVIVVIEETGKSETIDNSWLYSAVSRAQEQVILVGNMALFFRETARRPRAFNRVTGLNFDGNH